MTVQIGGAGIVWSPRCTCGIDAGLAAGETIIARNDMLCPKHDPAASVSGWENGVFVGERVAVTGGVQVVEDDPSTSPVDPVTGMP